MKNISGIIMGIVYNVIHDKVEPNIVIKANKISMAIEITIYNQIKN